MTALTASLTWLFGEGQLPQELNLCQIAARSIVLFLGGLVMIRLGKSRLLSRYNALDIILGFVLGSLLGKGISGAMSIPNTLMAVATLVAVHWCLTAVTSVNHGIGQWLKGCSVPLISDGVIHWDNLRRSHMSERDLYEAMRLNASIDDVSQVKAAYKERSGQISVIKRSAHPHIQEVTVHDGVQTVRIVISETLTDSHSTNEREITHHCHEADHPSSR